MHLGFFFATPVRLLLFQLLQLYGVLKSYLQASYLGVRGVVFPGSYEKWPRLSSTFLPFYHVFR